MGSNVPEQAQESRGKELSPAFLDDQGSLFEPIAVDVRTFCRRALRNHLKDAATLAFPKAPTVEQALMNLCRTLEERNGRHLDAEWLRVWARRWPWFREALAHYWAGDCGFVAIPKPDPAREEERIATIEKTLTDVLGVVGEAASELAELRKARKVSRRSPSCTSSA